MYRYRWVPYMIGSVKKDCEKVHVMGTFGTYDDLERLLFTVTVHQKAPQKGSPGTKWARDPFCGAFWCTVKKDHQKLRFLVAIYCTQILFQIFRYSPSDLVT